MFVLSYAGFSSAQPAATQPVTTNEPLSFNTHIRTILSDKCFACHGFDSKKRQADLRLDTAEGAVEAHDGKSAIVPGKIEESELWRRINLPASDEAAMPPAESHKALTQAEKDTLRRWIEQGAPYQKHWAFETIATPSIPAGAENFRNPIDAFIAERLKRDGLAIASEAEREVLIRRVAFALTGLPPTPEETRRYVGDKSDDAYEQMVERYLGSLHFGEEMARHWLDVARYADTHGMHLDNERQTWAYRDWVIGAFNRNLPFDQFTVEQLAGDLLPNATPDQITATGFNRCNVTTSEGGSINEELLYRYAVDRASTTIQTWLGLTGGCAVCHDHKFDPLTQREFYSFYAFFNSAADPAMDGNALLTQPVMKLMSDNDRSRLAEVDAKIAAVKEEINQRAAKMEYQDPAAADPLPAPQTLETVWMEDDFPAGGKLQASPGDPTEFARADASQPVFSGARSVRRKAGGLAQDVWDQATAPLILPQESKLFAHVWIAADDKPRSIMLQYFKDGWLHRAVWGEYTAIDWGKANTTERVHMGELPATGAWVKLEFSAEQVGLKAGDEIKGFALTQFGGTIYWDHVGVSGVSDPAKDPARSFAAWRKQVTGKDVPGLQGEAAQAAKAGPDKEAKPEVLDKLRTHYLQEVCETTKPQFTEFIARRTALQDERKKLDDGIPSTFIFKDLPSPRESFVMMRGAYDKPGDKVQPNVPAILPPLKTADPTARATRLDLAKWLVAPENPLTARVVVNRFWQQFFGTGLVKTSYDFGSQGEMPSHPELLDWLSNDFRESGWDVKALVRLIVSSRTFKQSSQITPDSYKHDPENRLLARGPRFRLDAEQIRDNALFVSGLINLEMGGKGVRTYQPENIWEPVGFAGSNTRFYQRDSGSSLYRRSIYTFFKRTAPPPFMVNFDAPNREQFCTKREKSNTPLQALQLMNDVQHVEAARALAERLIKGAQQPAERVRNAFQIVVARDPNERERTILLNELNVAFERYTQDAEAAKKLISQGESKPDAALNPAEVAAYTLIANTVLNLDETLTRN
ncbi:MAG: PSD1 and planctomycete cytochrome C domain-containing protein [Pirellulales bacterium]